MKLLKTAFTIMLLLALSAGPVPGFSTSPTTLSRAFDKNVADVNDVISVTVTFTNSEPYDLRGFYYAEQIPPGLTVVTTGVRVNGMNVSNFIFEKGSPGDVYPGNISYRWILETPPTFSQSNPIPSATAVQIVYSLSSSGEGTYQLDQFYWAGYFPGGFRAVFGQSEAVDRKVLTFTKGPFIADLSPSEAGWGTALKISGGNFGKKRGKIYLENPALLRKSITMKVKNTDWLENAIFSMVPSKVPSGYYLIRAVRKEDGAEAISPTLVWIESPLAGHYYLIMDEAYDTFPADKIDGLMQGNIKLNGPAGDVVTGMIGKDAFENGTFSQDRFTASYVDNKGILKKFFGIRVGDAILGSYHAALDASVRGGDWFGIKKQKIGDITGTYSLNLIETYDTATSSRPGGPGKGETLTLELTGAKLTGTFGTLPVAGALKNDTVELIYTDAGGHDVVMRGVVVEGLIAGLWEGQDGTAIWGGTFNACKAEIPGSLIGNYRYYKNEQYDSSVTDGPGGVSMGSLVVENHDGAAFSGTLDDQAFTGTLVDNRFEIVSSDALGNTARFAGCVKEGAFIALWEATYGTDKWGGSFWANKE